MKLMHLCRAAGLDCPTAFQNTEIMGVAMDSRRVLPGGLFVCIRGLHRDAHEFLPDALRRGAVCVVGEGEAELPHGTIYLKTDNARRAAALLYDAWYGYPSSRLRFIGVTGTNGKTSVTHMLHRILAADLHRCGLIGTVGCESLGRRLEGQNGDALANMTTPDPPELYRMLAEMVRDGVEYVLMEVTSHALALDKLAPITFDIGIFTNLTPEHLDMHGSMDAYANEKSKLFAHSRKAIINLDSAYADRMRVACTGQQITCSQKHNADFTVRDAQGHGDAGVSYTLISQNTQMRISCPIAGEFTVINSMQAAVCALQLGISTRTVKNALSSMSGIKGRMERVKVGFDADFSVLIDYAHTPDAFENLLRAARGLLEPCGRLVLLFGCGGDRDRSKRAVMGAVAAKYADAVIVTSDNSRGEDPQQIIDEILKGIPEKTPCTVILDRRAAITHAVAGAQTGDLILLAGKGHEEYEITREGRFPFYEREIVKSAYAARRKQEKNSDSTETGR